MKREKGLNFDLVLNWRNGEPYDNLPVLNCFCGTDDKEDGVMAKNQRKLNKANHGKRPASSKGRKLKRRHLCM